MSCPLSYTISITGDCLNDLSGAFSLDIVGTAPNYTIQWISPYTTTIPLGPGVVTYSETGLSGGTYTFNIVDSCAVYNALPVNVYISTGTCVSITSQTNTLCGLDNGSLTATTTNLYGTGSFSLYEMSSGYITSGVSIVSSYTFGSLSAGTYYVVANDGGGCTGKSETCIIKDSLPLDIGLYTVNDAGCAVNSGSIHITGLTGTPPYTYLWSPGGQTTQSITGLTAGVYSITVTDGSGCIQSSGVTVTTVPHVGFGSFTVVSPSCFSSDGEVTIIITGGTAPYYYSGSNGTVAVSFATTHTFTDLFSGPFSVQVTDAGLCNFVQSTSLLTPGGLSVTSVDITNSICNNTSGKILVTIFGGTGPYTYTLTDPLGNSSSSTGGFLSWTFDGLSSGDYILTISDGGPCVFTHTYTIDNIELFELSVETTGTTCNLSDGAVTLNITAGGTAPYHYEIDGGTVFSSDLSYTFTDLSSGNYTATVTDSSGCSQILPFTINNSSTVDFVLVGTDSTDGTNGTISTFITSGEPPYILNWSSNVNGQTGLNINTLSAGTYTLTVTDNNGCVQTRDIVINGFSVLSSYQTFNICDDDFMNTGQTVRKGPQQMLTEGFYDLTSGDTNCVLHQTIFYADVTVNGVTQNHPFYTGTTLNDYPLDSLFYDVVKEILVSYDGVGEVLLDYLNNIITINTNCNSKISLIDADVKIALKISYDIACQTCGLTCHCYVISGPKGCEISFLDCDSNNASLTLKGTNDERICAIQIGNITCPNVCTNPYDYFFKTVEDMFVWNAGLDGGEPLGNTDLMEVGFKATEADLSIDSYINTLESMLKQGLVISNATGEICCPNCGDEHYYALGPVELLVILYESLGFPTCCNSISGDTSIILKYEENMVDLFGEIPPNCNNDFGVCLNTLSSIVGSVNMDQTILENGIGETGFIDSNSILCFLNDILTNLSVTYSFTQENLYSILNVLLKNGFAVDCKNDTIYMGGVYSYLKYVETTDFLNVVYPPAECPGVIYDNVGECVDGVCPDDSCINGLTYLFDQLDSSVMFEQYLKNLVELIREGIIVYNPSLRIPICCPDCGYYLLSYVETSLKFFEGSRAPAICCLNEATSTETYLKLVEAIGSLYEGVYPKVCCNEFEPCLPQFEENFMPVILRGGIIETPYYNNHSNLCILNDIILNLPYTDLQLARIVDAILSLGIVVWCCNDDVYIASVENYLSWQNSGGCPEPCRIPEFKPINCDITNEYCETTETKVISSVKINMFGADYLDDPNIIPTRCEKLPTIIDCPLLEDKESEFTHLYSEFFKYELQRVLLLEAGLITGAANLPVVLPPSRYEGDYFYDGPDNNGWKQFNILQGCSCKKMYADEGLIGPQYDFDIVYLTEVQSYINLPLTGQFGQHCFVIDDGIFYIWNPNTLSWVSYDTPIIGYPDMEDCAFAQRNQQQDYIKALNELLLAMKPFTWATFNIPLYQIFKYKT
jgi:hypothetical protein